MAQCILPAAGRAFTDSWRTSGQTVSFQNFSTTKVRDGGWRIIKRARQFLFFAYLLWPMLKFFSANKEPTTASSVKALASLPTVACSSLPCCSVNRNSAVAWTKSTGLSSFSLWPSCWGYRQQECLCIPSTSRFWPVVTSVHIPIIP